MKENTKDKLWTLLIGALFFIFLGVFGIAGSVIATILFGVYLFVIHDE